MYRILAHTKSHLVEIGRDASGWKALYPDPNDGRYWELSFRQGQVFTIHTFEFEYPTGTRDTARDAEDVRDHVARDHRAVEHQIDQRWQLGGRAPPLQLALEQLSPREPPIMALVHSAPRGSCSTTAR